MLKDALQLSEPISIVKLVAKARESHLVGFAATVGKTIEEARPIHAETEARLASNPILVAERMREEFAVLPLMDLLQRMTPAGEPIQVNQSAMLDQARSMDIKLPERSIHLAMGRLIVMYPSWEFGRNQS